MNQKKYFVMRDITPEECPWLDKTIEEGTIVYWATDPYGCCTPEGQPVTLYADPYPYFELPKDALQEYAGYAFSNN